jgi:hypothetical protein
MNRSSLYALRTSWVCALLDSKTSRSGMHVSVQEYPAEQPSLSLCGMTYRPGMIVSSPLSLTEPTLIRILRYH